MSRMHLGAALAVAALALAGTASADTADKSHAPTTGRSGSSRPTRSSSPRSSTPASPGPSVGDLVVARDDVLRENGSPAGTFRQTCTLVDLGEQPVHEHVRVRRLDRAEDGTITMEGPFDPSQAESVAAITGGTGEYRTARGEIVVRAEADEIVVKLAR